MVYVVITNHTFWHFENCWAPISFRPTQESKTTLSATSHTIKVDPEPASMSQTSGSQVCQLGVHTSMCKGCRKTSKKKHAGDNKEKLDMHASMRQTLWCLAVLPHVYFWRTRFDSARFWQSPQGLKVCAPEFFLLLCML